MNGLIKNILTGLAFVTGIVGFMSGEYIISSALFAVTTYTSNINVRPKKQKH
jgi:hypothetical protein